MSNYRIKIHGETNEFYHIETPPSSTPSKDSTDDSTMFWSHSNRFNIRQEPMIDFDYEKFNSSVYDDMHTPLRRTLGNTKLKTRQDVRRFRKFLKRNYNLQSMALIDIDPDRLRTYLMDYLTSIRTRKGLKYDPETLRSYYLSIQRFLKDSNYPFCLRNSPHFAPCRELIIQMRKEKSQNKISSNSPQENETKKISRCHVKQPLHEQSPSVANHLESMSTNDEIIEIKPEEYRFCSTVKSNDFSAKYLLPSSSLPPRKRQQMKYFLEMNSTLIHEDSHSFSSSSPIQHVLSSDAYALLIQLTQSSSSQTIPIDFHLKQLLDRSNICGYSQRILLANLCQEWQGDIRLLHSNLRSELNSLLPHILLSNILSKRNSS